MDEARHAWRVADGQTLARHEWDGEAVLFNDLSGATHLLTSSALWVLDRLRASPADADRLAAELGHMIEAEAAAEAEADAGVVDGEHLDSLLSGLHQMNLIAPC